MGAPGIVVIVLAYCSLYSCADGSTIECASNETHAPGEIPAKVEFPQNYTKIYANGTVTVGGVEAVRWIGCQHQLGAGTTGMQVEVAFAGLNSTAPYSPQIQNPIVLSVLIILYNETDKTIMDRVSFDIPEVDTPKGIVTDELDMLYDADERIISFRLNALADRDAPFIGNASLPKDFSLVDVIHDFKFGLQYILDGDNNACKEVKAIDADFGDVLTLDVATKQIDMKSVTEVVMNVSKAEFYYGGKVGMFNISSSLIVVSISWLCCNLLPPF
uniref:LolA-like domain-containing protein n=1 Tax=Parascaris equorum TaxID=6256 RepID=A0A914RUZ3_PAREQ